MQLTDRQTVYEGFHKVQEVTLKDGGQEIKREQFDRGHSVAALVYDESDHQIILIQQYRVGPEKELVEVVAGSLDEPSENPQETMKREIREEIGYQTEILEFINEFYTTPGACTEKIFLYAAQVSQKIEEGGGVGEESIQLYRMSPEEFETAVFEDAKTLIAQEWWRRNKSLFFE